MEQFSFMMAGSRHHNLIEVPGDAPPKVLIVEKPTWFGLFWQRVLVAMGLGRNLLGGFGGMAPVPRSG